MRGSLYLDRILNGSDIDRDVFEFVQRRIQRRGFSAPRRSRDQDDSVREVEQGTEEAEVVLGKPEVVEVDHHR